MGIDERKGFPKTLQNHWQTNKIEESRYAANPSAPGGPTSALRGTGPPSKRACAKLLEKQRKTKVFSEAQFCCLTGTRRRILGVDSRSGFPKNASKSLGKQTKMKNPANQQIRMRAGVPLRCLRCAPATHWRGSILDKVSQHPVRIIGKTNTFYDPRFATNEGSNCVFQIAAWLPGTSTTL